MAIAPLFIKAITNLFKSPATLMYPVKTREFFPHTRGNIENKVENCIFCGICKMKCPAHAIEVNRTEKSWTIDSLKCVICGACVEACPKKCLVMGNKYSSALSSEEKSGSVSVKKAA